MSRFLVVDTSVLVSALIGGQGPAREVLRRCLQGRYRPLMSNALLGEYEDALARPRIREICPLPEPEIRELVNAFYNVCEWIPIYFLWRPNLADEGDNFLVELALAGNAEVIVTNNVRDLHAAELKFPGVAVQRPQDLLRGDT